MSASQDFEEHLLPLARYTGSQAIRLSGCAAVYDGYSLEVPHDNDRAERCACSHKAALCGTARARSDIGGRGPTGTQITGLLVWQAART